MAKYRETTITTTATEWVRCHRLVIDLPLQGEAVLTFQEEFVRDDGTTVTTAPRATLYDPGCIVLPAAGAGDVTIFDLKTLQPTNKTRPLAELLAELQSAYLTAALARDG